MGKPCKKEDLNNMEKRLVMELFVENDITMSHLLEFISGKFIDAKISQQAIRESLTTESHSQRKSSVHSKNASSTIEGRR